MTGARTQQRVQAALFDVNGTLWDKAACDRQVMEIVLPRFMDRLPEDDPEQVIRRFNAVLFDLPGRRHLRGKRPLSRARRFEALLESYGVRTRGLARDLTRTFDTTRRLIMRRFLRPDALAVLRALGRMGVQRGVIMNGPPAVQRHLLDTLGLRSHLDLVVLAEVEGYAKPDVRLFQRTVALTGQPADRVLHVGDSPLTDALGAQRAGLVTVWLDTGRRRLPAGFPRPDFAVRSLSEVLPLVES